jgi:hypothetical protein
MTKPRRRGATPLKDKPHPKAQPPDPVAPDTGPPPPDHAGGTTAPPAGGTTSGTTSTPSTGGTTSLPPTGGKAKPQAAIDTPGPGTPTPESAATLTTRAGAPSVSLTNLESTLLLGGRRKTGLNLSLHFGGNDIDATVSNGPSGTALVVLDEEVKAGDVEVCGNTLRNRFGFPTVLVSMATGTCVIAGNTIINELSSTIEGSRLALSLLVNMNPAAGSDPAAISGNCLRGRFLVNPQSRPQNVPQPMNDWTWFNAQF